MIKTVVFDIGNVVWRFRPLQTRVFRQWAKLLGVSLHDFRLNFYEKNGLYRRFETDDLSLSDWLADIAPDLDPNIFLKIFNQTYQDRTEFSKYINMPVVEFISTLRQHHLPVGCLSNLEKQLSASVEEYLLPNFDYHILSWQVRCRKPNPKIYREIFKHGKFLPSEILFIDDTPVNVAAAKKLGINSVLFTTASQLKHDLKKYFPKDSPLPKKGDTSR